MRLILTIVCIFLRVSITAARVPLATSVSPWYRCADSDNPFLQYNRVATTAAATTADLITCGYKDGNINSPRSAGPGFDCRVDTAHGIWGFCPITVIAATECGLAAACIDSGSCSSVCQVNSNSALTTFTCPSSGTQTFFCSTAMLTFGVDQAYSYIACGNEASIEHYVVTPTFTSSSSITSSAEPLSTPSSAAKSALPTLSSPNLASLPVMTGITGSASASASARIDDAKVHASSGSNLGAIIGGAIGGIALVCLSTVAVVLIVKRRSSHKNMPSTDPIMTSTPPDLSYPFQSSGAPVYEADSSSSSQKVLRSDPIPDQYPRNPVELPSNANY